MRQAWSFGSLLALRCPACGADTFKAGFFRTAKRCSRCGEDFEPELGFYAGSIYAMYGMGALAGALGALVAGLLGAGFTGTLCSAAGAMLCLSPWIFWYARLGFLFTNHRFFKDQA